jgi:hypothetical protein
VASPVHASGPPSPGKEAGVSFRVHKGPILRVEGPRHGADQDKQLYPALGKMVPCFSRSSFALSSGGYSLLGLHHSSSPEIWVVERGCNVPWIASSVCGGTVSGV